jgi:hypothetical protein
MKMHILILGSKPNPVLPAGPVDHVACVNLALRHAPVVAGVPHEHVFASLIYDSPESRRNIGIEPLRGRHAARLWLVRYMDSSAGVRRALAGIGYVADEILEISREESTRLAAEAVGAENYAAWMRDLPDGSSDRCSTGVFAACHYLRLYPDATIILAGIGLDRPQAVLRDGKREGCQHIYLDRRTLPELAKTGRLATADASLAAASGIPLVETRQ